MNVVGFVLNYRCVNVISVNIVNLSLTKHSLFQCVTTCSRYRIAWHHFKL